MARTRGPSESVLSRLIALALQPEGEELTGTEAGRPRRRRAWIAFAALLSLSMLASAAEADARIKLRSPALSPHFSPPARDYVVSCVKPIELRVEVSGRTRARIGEGPWHRHSTRKKISLRPDERVTVDSRGAGPRGPRTYSIRCLPPDFSPYTFRRIGHPAAPFYLVTPDSTGLAAFEAHYAVVFTRWGAPIWWYRDRPSPFDAKVLPGGIFVWTNFHGALNTDPGNAYTFRRPNGKVVRRLRTVGSPTDVHDLEPMANGDYMTITYRRRDHVDLSAYPPHDPDASIYDGVVQELTPAGQLVRQWSTGDHISPAETDPYWWSQLSEPYDSTHVNAVEPLKDGDFLISLRHTNAVYRIDGKTGEIEWKLGGTPTPQSLQVRNDPMAANPLGGQHDVRSLGHGEISIHDNGIPPAHPRAIRYKIHDGVATLEESISDPLVGDSFCCGSARRFAGSWLISWGGNPLVTEFDPQHRRIFSLTFSGGGSSYRAVPITDELTAEQLRRGMDAQFAR
jgi:Arylsulfotransferase (ASST)